jgi:hypothetical protein
MKDSLPTNFSDSVGWTIARFFILAFFNRISQQYNGKVCALGQNIFPRLPIVAPI